MRYLLGKTSFLFLISGAICIAQGLAVCLWPDLNFVVLTYLFALSATTQGVTQFKYGTYRRFQYRGMIVLYFGIINIAAGQFLIFYPRHTELLFMAIIGISWISTAVVMLLLALFLYKETQHDFWLILSGIFSIAAGIYLFLNFQRGIESFVWMTALYGFLFGTLTILFGIRARAWSHIYFEDVME
jgi:uncharacterized membrane protein HdeD (DUF308 family)